MGSFVQELQVHVAVPTTPTLPAPPAVPVGLTPAGIPGVDGVSKFLPARIYDGNRAAPLKVFTYNAATSQPGTPLSGLLLKVQSNLASRGIKLSSLGPYNLASSQKWFGGQFLTPIPPTTIVATNINEFWVAADEIVIKNNLNATIKVAGTVIMVANKITVEPGAQINWLPPDPFSTNQFDWKNANGADLVAASGANGAAGVGHTWSNSAPPADKQGQPGGNGANGLAGNSGPDAPSIILVARDITSLPIINLVGFRGGAGQHGGNGGNGGAGDKGEPAQSNWGFNSRGCGWGGNGGPGGNAGRGGMGGPGGRGGDVVIYTLQATRDTLTSQPMTTSLQPGPGGNGGAPGLPGQGGAGGPHGDRTGMGEIDDTNRNGSPGPTGQPDQTPPAQLRGSDGCYHGSLTFNVVTDADITATLSESVIVKFTPNSGRPGDVITLCALNVPADTAIGFGSTTIPVTSWTNNASNYTAQFRVPENVPGGMTTVNLLDKTGKVISIVPESFLVLPRLDSLSGDAHFGAKIILNGAGFAPDSHVLYGPQTLNTISVAPNQIHFQIPTPSGAFEQNAATIGIAVVNPDGYNSNGIQVGLDHWLHLGFNPAMNGFQFTNDQGTIKAANVNINLDLFTETFGADDRAILVPDDPGSVLGDITDPAQVALGWLFFGLYVEFLNSAPGICNGMSAYALDHFFSSGSPLYNLYPTFTGQIARDVTALQGRVLSAQALDSGVAAVVSNATSGDVCGAKTFLAQLETAIRQMIQANTLDHRKAYPLLSFVPAYEGITKLMDFFSKLSEDHTILPYAIRYGSQSDNFIARIYCYNNWHNDTRRTVRLSIAPDYGFTTEEFVGAAGCEYDKNAQYSTLQNGPNVVYQSMQGWAIAPMPMGIAFYNNVDVPTDLFAYLSPVVASLDDGKGHVIGKVDGDLFSQSQFMAPSPFVPGVFRLGAIDHLTVNLTGKVNGTYKAGMHTLNYKTSAGVLNVPVTANQSDTAVFDLRSAQVIFKPGNNVKGVKLSSALHTPEGVASSVLSGLSLKAGEQVEIGNAKNQLTTRGPAGELGSLEMKFENANRRSATQTIDLTNLAGNTLNWSDLAKKVI